MKAPLSFLSLACLLLASCIEDTDTEIEQPVIELQSPEACEVLTFGQSFTYRVKITDNTGLGNISMDLHHNFGHHNHGANETCDLEAVKSPENPFSDSWIFSLPEEKLEHVFETTIELPALKDGTTPFDPGDYHFHIYVTDNDGYQIFTTRDVKITNE